MKQGLAIQSSTVKTLTLSLRADAAVLPSQLTTAGDAQCLSSFCVWCGITGAEDPAAVVYRLLRGIDDSDITPRSKPKQRGAGKSFARKALCHF